MRISDWSSDVCSSDLAERPGGASWAQVYGMALLCGIGFTMSLFIGALAFPHSPTLVEQAKIGILAGSLLSAIMGYLVLRGARRSEEHTSELQSLMRLSYAVFCLKKKNTNNNMPT